MLLQHHKERGILKEWSSDRYSQLTGLSRDASYRLLLGSVAVVVREKITQTWGRVNREGLVVDD